MSPSIPDNIRLYAIGDVHGCSDLLATLLEQIVAHDLMRREVSTKMLVFMGDYVDRGNNSKGVIDQILQNLPQEYDAIFLKGNHEEMMLEALDNSEAAGFWLRNGGVQTLNSYGIQEIVNGLALTSEVLLHEFRLKIPPAHRQFLDSLQLKFECGDYYFAHAGVHPDKPLDQQEGRHLMWIRDRFLSSNKDFGKVIVYGHTPTRDVDTAKNRIGIDTAAVYGGKLTALMLEGQEQLFLYAKASPKEE